MRTSIFWLSVFGGICVSPAHTLALEFSFTDILPPDPNDTALHRRVCIRRSSHCEADARRDGQPYGLEGIEACELFDMLLNRRPLGELARTPAHDLAPCIERFYAESMDWIAERGTPNLITGIL